MAERIQVRLLKAIELFERARVLYEKFGRPSDLEKMQKYESKMNTLVLEFAAAVKAEKNQKS